MPPRNSANGPVASSRSRYRSSTSAAHVGRAPGDETIAPERDRRRAGQRGADDRRNRRAETCARYQVDGSRVPRCGSLASSGLPVAVSVPSTTQLFEPSPRSSRYRRERRATAGSPRTDSRQDCGTMSSPADRRARSPRQEWAGCFRRRDACGPSDRVCALCPQCPRYRPGLGTMLRPSIAYAGISCAIRLADRLQRDRAASSSKE